VILLNMNANQAFCEAIAGLCKILWAIAGC